MAVIGAAVSLDAKLYSIQQEEVGQQEFASCYKLLSETFHPEELDDPAGMSADLIAPAGGMVRFFMLARRLSEAPQHVVSLIAGCYLSLSETPYAGFGAGFIEYLVTHPDFRQQGHASALLTGFESALQREADARGENLSLVLGEVEEDLVSFKLKRGYCLLPGSCYAQPPISFDKLSGSPLSAPLPKLLMAKQISETLPASAPLGGLLPAVVKQVFIQRYGLRSQTGLPAENARLWILEHIWQPFVESIS